ncbi:hypothetical protein [Mesorhizobium sp. B4-1-1]|uniref:hypothetical protein n=1 Tax=Mesorhizobium sp. B4-1-1 TaxID=2589890 RepID=UPI00112BCC11|nr:hypothetical protein [Mesorhizobium sp. B4-1-1]TPI10275.1 hypothetical protein FJW10_29620 [Mesorhizobium sp. B4-1-1]
MSIAFTHGPAYVTTDPIVVSFSRRNRLTESVASPLGWTEPDQDPEDGQTTVIEVLDPTGTTVVTTHSGITGTSFDVPKASFGGNASGFLQIWAERDGIRSYQPYRIQVIFANLESASFTLTGNPARVGPMLSASAGSFALAGPDVQFSQGFAVPTGSFALAGGAAGLSFSTGMVAGVGSFALTGIAATLSAQLNTTLDPATKGSNVTLSSGNLSATNSGTTKTGARSVHSKASGKYYFEWTVNAHQNAVGANFHAVGVATEEVPYADADAVACMAAVAFENNNTANVVWSQGVNSASFGGTTDGDVWSAAIDLDNAMVWFRQNGGNWNGSGTANPATNTGGIKLHNMLGMAVSPFWGTDKSGDRDTFNFGDSAFTYTVPSGFTAGWPSTPDDGNATSGKTTLSGPDNVNVTLSNGSLTASHSNSSNAIARSKHAKASGKYYVEFTVGIWANTNDGIGFAYANATATNVTANGSNSTAVYRSGNIWASGSTGTSLGSVANGDRIDAAIDLDNKLVWYRKNGGSWNNSGTADPATGTGGKSLSGVPGVSPFVGFGTATGQSATINVGDTSFVGSVPSGFTAGWPVA